jgi:hypothetical protein
MSTILLVSLIVGVLVNVAVTALLFEILPRGQLVLRLYTGVTARTFRAAILRGYGGHLRHGHLLSNVNACKQ